MFWRCNLCGFGTPSKRLFVDLEEAPNDTSRGFPLVMDIPGPNWVSLTCFCWQDNSTLRTRLNEAETNVTILQSKISALQLELQEKMLDFERSASLFIFLKNVVHFTSKSLWLRLYLSSCLDEGSFRSLSQATTCPVSSCLPHTVETLPCLFLKLNV